MKKRNIILLSAAILPFGSELVQASSGGPSLNLTVAKKEIKSSEALQVKSSAVSAIGRRINLSGLSAGLSAYSDSACSQDQGSTLGISMSGASTTSSMSLPAGQFYIKLSATGYSSSSCIGPITVLDDGAPFEKLVLSENVLSGSQSKITAEWKSNANNLSVGATEKASLMLVDSCESKNKLSGSRVYSLSPKKGSAQVKINRPSGLSMAYGALIKTSDGSKESCISMNSVGLLGDGSGVCYRHAQGSSILESKQLFSKNGVLEADVYYNSMSDPDFETTPGDPSTSSVQRFCMTLADGSQAPVFHVKPGDHLVWHVHNQLSSSEGGVQLQDILPGAGPSGGGLGFCKSFGEDGTIAIKSYDSSSLNLHTHGLNTSSACGSDQAVQTVFGSGEAFTYSFDIPSDETPGIYWYHPHIHGLAESAVQGGATGVIIVDGIEQVQPQTAGLPQRIIELRDNLSASAMSMGLNPGDIVNGKEVPSWEVSVNYVKIPFNAETGETTPANIKMKKGQKELWRIVSSFGDSVVDLQLLYDDVAQPLKIVGIDGVPTNSRDVGNATATPMITDHILMPVGQKVDVIVTPPKEGVVAKLVTKRVDIGVDGDIDPEHDIATISLDGKNLAYSIPKRANQLNLNKNFTRFKRLAQAQPALTRGLYFNEYPNDQNLNPAYNGDGNDTSFTLTEKLSSSHSVINPDGSPASEIRSIPSKDPVTNEYLTSSTYDTYGPYQTNEHPFDLLAPPTIVATQNTVEDWTIENRTKEVHVFHIHQIHFKVLSSNFSEFSIDSDTGKGQFEGYEGQYLDDIALPTWDGSYNEDGTPHYPRVTLRMDFRGNDTTGIYVYHCHILEHEDKGMMQPIVVVPEGTEIAQINKIRTTPINKLYAQFKVHSPSTGHIKTKDRENAKKSTKLEKKDGHKKCGHCKVKNKKVNENKL